MFLQNHFKNKLIKYFKIFQQFLLFKINLSRLLQSFLNTVEQFLIIIPLFLQYPHQLFIIVLVMIQFDNSLKIVLHLLIFIDAPYYFCYYFTYVGYVESFVMDYFY